MQSLAPCYEEVTRLIGRALGREAILDRASPDARLAVEGILDGLETTGLVVTRENGLAWNGPEPPAFLQRLTALRDGPAGAFVSVPVAAEGPVSVCAVPDGPVGSIPHLKSWGGAAGTGFSVRSAAVSCLFEVAERCSQVRSGDEDARIASLAELGDEGIDPDALLLAAGMDEPASIQSLDPDLPIAWSPARDLATGKRRWLPQDYCYRSANGAEAAWSCPSDSNGCASGTSSDDVIVRGFLEAVERDAIAIWWHNRIPRPACAPVIADLDPIRSIAIWQERLGRRLHLLDLTTDLEVPVVAAVSSDANGRGIAVGFGAHFGPDGAAIRACLEMVQFQSMVQLSLRFRDLGRVTAPSAATRAAWSWFEEVSISEEAYLMPETNAVPVRPAPLPVPSDRSGETDWCLALAARHGLDVFHLDLTRSWIGIPAGRVIVPGLRSTKPRYGRGRLYDVPVKLGWLPVPRRRGEMNPRAMVF